VQTLGHEEYRHYELKSLRSNYEDITKEHREARAATDNVLKLLQDIVSQAACTPYHTGEGEARTNAVRCPEAARRNLRRMMESKSPFLGLYGVYSITLS